MPGRIPTLTIVGTKTKRSIRSLNIDDLPLLKYITAVDMLWASIGATEESGFGKLAATW